MKKKLLNHFFPPQEKIKPLLIMKLTLSLIIFTAFQASASVFPQAVKVNIDVRNGSLENVIGQIREQSDYMFVYEVADIKGIGSVTVRMNSANIDEVLAACLNGSNITYTLKDNMVVLTKTRQAAQQPATPTTITVKGVVKDAQGKALDGVSVMLKSNNRVGTKTDAAGAFSITVPIGDKLRFEYLGMKDQEIDITRSTETMNVVMSIRETQMTEVSVISTGFSTREKATFTGNVTSITGDQLREVSSRSVLSSLAILDPSFRVIEDINAGSNPNSLPSIEIRGGGAVSLYAVTDEFSQDPNMPLFVLNGVEVSFDRIYDLDPDRIESVHILKDAGSTAIYGSKGANGVVVIETIKPKAGEYNIYYSGTFGLDAPDLSVYNMMNAAEKLEFERLAGRFTNPIGLSSGVGYAISRIELDKYYNEIRQRIESGVDTYWLAEPVRSAFSNNHSVRIAGGSQELSLDITAKYGRTNGVMKNSFRDSWGGASQIQYRAGKFIVSNDTEISGHNSAESNYGSFKTWVNTSPYYEKDETSKYLKEKANSIIDGNTTVLQQYNVPNPFWNANLNSRNETEQLTLSNNFMIQFKPDDHFLVQGNFFIKRTQALTTVFKDPKHTDFENKEYFEKGSYSAREARGSEYEGKLRVNYGTSINNVHNISALFSAYLSQRDNTSLTTEVEGFSYGSQGFPGNADGYKPDSRPVYVMSKRRQVGVLLTASYNYDTRYLFDLTIKTDGATTFGANNLYKPFWSVGVGWNINREAFASSWDAIDIFRVRGSIGTNGNQSIGQVYSKTVYKTLLESNVFGQGAEILYIGTPDLPWSVVRKLDASMELRAWRGRFSFLTSFFHEKTDPLIINVPQIPSTGNSTYPTHIGYSVKRGVEFDVSFNPIHNMQERIYWTIKVNGTHFTEEYGGFGDKLENLNALMQESTTFAQYRDGYSEDDLWAVRSYGIDPATGREVFIKKDGSLTYIYNASDIVRIGKSRPTLDGSINTNFRYKNFGASASLYYSFGGYIYNSALYDKVENIARADINNNQDKRALYDRWRYVGDVTQFRAINIDADKNSVTSRFIQKNNYLRGAAFNAFYEINDNDWIRNNMGIRRMTITFGMDELFRFETAKYERGIEYPFARKFTLKVSLNF